MDFPFLNISESGNTGGHPIHVDDLYVLQESIYALAGGLALNCDANPATGVVLGGCSSYVNSGGGGNASCNEGVLFYQNKLWVVPALPTTSIPIGQALYLTFSAQPIRTAVFYLNGTARQVHTKGVCTFVVAASAPPNSVLASSVLTKRIFWGQINALNASVANLITRVTLAEGILGTAIAPWTSIPTVDIPAMVSGVAVVASGCQYLYRLFGTTMELNITLELNASSTANQFTVAYPSGVTHQVTTGAVSNFTTGADRDLSSPPAFTHCIAACAPNNLAVIRSTTGSRELSFNAVIPIQ